MKSSKLFALSVAFAALSLTRSAYAAYEYLITDLGTLSGPISSALNLDQYGRAAGSSMLADSNFRAVLWDGAPISLGALPGDTQSLACAINDAGQVVGISYNYGELQPHAFSWAAGAMTPLGNFAPRDLNSAGVVVGRRTFFDAAGLLLEQACRWDAGTLSDLGTLGGANSEAFSINTTGTIAGQSQLADNLTIRACVWVNGQPHDLGAIAPGATARSSAADINDSGRIAGWSEVSGGISHACAFQIDATGQVTSRTDLGVLGGGASYACGVNNSGDIVGTSDSRAFIWRAGLIKDLNTLIPPGAGWSVSRAAAINDSGQIVADGVQYGFTHAVLLTPVTCTKGDVNDDGRVDGLDIQAFAKVLLLGGTPRETCAADMSIVQDGQVTAADVPSFVACVTDPASCP